MRRLWLFSTILGLTSTVALGCDDLWDAGDEEAPPAARDAAGDGSAFGSEIDPQADGPRDGEVANDHAILDGGPGDAPFEDGAPPIADGGSEAAPPDPPDTGPGGNHAASLWESPALPALDAATVAHVREIRAVGVTRGNRAAVIAKLGDSITATPNFLTDIGNGNFTLGAYSALSGTIQAVRGVTLSDGKNAFNRTSTGAKGGWTSGNVLGPPSAVEAEITSIRPAYAIVMFGTNDGNSATLYTNLNTIVDQLEAEGTVPILSTIPRRVDYASAGEVVAKMNNSVKATASERHLPLIDLFTALAPLPNFGISSDKVHPSVEGPGTSGDFTADGLEYGYNMRNLTALQMLDRLRALP